MAFDKNGLSYLDNIPFKISSAFLPPPPVVLPTVLNADEEFPFEKFHYDFSKEKKILEDIANKDRSKLECESALKTETNHPKLQEPGLNSSVKSNVQNIFSLQSDILLPKPQKAVDKVSITDNKNYSKINLSDFENDTSSPFDYMELQTINDLEELSNVFQGLNNKYSSDDNVYKDKNSTSDGLNENNLASNVSKSMSFPLQNNDGFENTEKFLTSAKEKDNHSIWSTSPRENCFYSVPSATHSFDLGSEGQGQSLEKTFSSVVPKVPCLSFPSVRNNSVKNGFADSASSKSALRGCKSYSDIHQLSEHFTGDSLKQVRSSTPPSSTFAVIEATPSPLSDSKNEISSGDVNCDNSSTLSDLPDPYNELTEDDRRFVDAIVGMGFPRAQVSRSVKHLGSDEKTVVEHLCQIQTLEESGYDCLEAEAALHLHDYNQDQAKQFLDLIDKFQDLGFEKNAVKKALIQNKNDYDKTIDALLS